MSAWFNNAPPLLLEDSVKIAVDFLDRAGEIDDIGETCQFLVNKVGFMIAPPINAIERRGPSNCPWSPEIGTRLSEGGQVLASGSHVRRVEDIYDSRPDWSLPKEIS